ncbi:MAG: hypothetical protein R3E95_04530 [Thiolinea sp.]
MRFTSKPDKGHPSAVMRSGRKGRCRGLKAGAGARHAPEKDKPPIGTIQRSGEVGDPDAANVKQATLGSPIRETVAAGTLV